MTIQIAKLRFHRTQEILLLEVRMKLSVTINRDGLPNGISNFNLNLNINNIKSETIVLSIDNFKEQKLILNGDVMDAEYSKVKDQLVFVSANPSKVSIYNPSTASIENIPLIIHTLHVFLFHKMEKLQ